MLASSVPASNRRTSSSLTPDRFDTSLEPARVRTSLTPVQPAASLEPQRFAPSLSSALVSAGRRSSSLSSARNAPFLRSQLRSTQNASHLRSALLYPSLSVSALRSCRSDTHRVLPSLSSCLTFAQVGFCLLDSSLGSECIDTLLRSHLTYLIGISPLLHRPLAAIAMNLPVTKASFQYLLSDNAIIKHQYGRCDVTSLYVFGTG